MATLGKYELLDQLGTGSMGTVYRALDTLLEREVALKTFRAIPSMGAALTERFYREAKAGAKLQHPSIVTIYELGEIDGTVFIAMEALTGSTLRQIIAEGLLVDTYSKLELMVQTCDGLAHAHRAGIVHRDIKPSNIFRTAGNRAKILDFGIARMPASVLTMTGSVLGTPNYMSPEQILGNPCDARTDLFSAAIVLFELLTGVHPFRSVSIPRRIVTGPPERLLDIDPTLPASLDALLTKALALDPVERFQTGETMAAEIRAIASEYPRLDGTLADLAHDSAAVPKGLFASRSTPPASDLPSGGDNTEWRISEFLRLLQEFDEALESGRLEPAHRHLQGMRYLESRDERFTVAVLEYEGRLLELESHYRAASSPGESTDSGTEAFGIDTALLTPVEQDGGGDDYADSHSDAPNPEPIEAAPKVRLRYRTEHLLSLTAACGLIVLLIFAIYGLVLRDRRPVQVLPSFGTAQVRAQDTPLYLGAARTDAVIERLRKGNIVNIFATGNPSPEWVRIQPVAGRRVSAPGFVKASDLDRFSTLQALRTIQPGKDASIAQRTAYLEQVKGYLESHAGQTDSREARMEIAAQNIALAQSLHKAGGSSSQVQQYSDAAVAMLNQIGSDAEFSDKVRTDRRELDFLRETVQKAPRDSAGGPGFELSKAVPPGVGNGPEAGYDPSLDIHRATVAWQSGDYARAKRLLKRVLHAQPGNSKAKELLDKIGRAQVVDPGVSQ